MKKVVIVFMKRITLWVKKMRSSLVTSNSLFFNSNLLKIVKMGQTGWQGVKGTCVQTWPSEFDASETHVVEREPRPLDTVLWLLHTHHGTEWKNGGDCKMKNSKETQILSVQQYPPSSPFSVSSLSFSPESKADPTSPGLSQSFMGILLHMGESTLHLSERSEKIPGHMSRFACYIIVATFSCFTNFKFSHVKWFMLYHCLEGRFIYLYTWKTMCNNHQWDKHFWAGNVEEVLPNSHWKSEMQSYGYSLVHSGWVACMWPGSYPRINKKMRKKEKNKKGEWQDRGWRGWGLEGSERRRRAILSGD